MFTFEANLLCDTPDCSAIVTGEVADHSGQAMCNAEDEAKKSGWVKTNKGTWLCDVCKEAIAHTKE